MSDKMREEFEAAMLDMFEINLEPFRAVDDTGFDGYRLDECFTSERSQLATCAWMMWQASRSTVVIELPIPKEACGPDGSYMEYFEPEQIDMAIEAAGLKVKP